MSLLFDTGVWYAFLNKDDDHHAEARALVTEGMEGLHGALLTTADVVDETFTLLLSRGVSRAHARRLADQIGWIGDGVPLATLLEVDRPLRRRAWQLYDRHYEDRGLSFTDCTSLAVIEDRGIDAIASFDDSFDGLVERVDGTG